MKINNANSFFRNTPGLDSETELMKSDGKSENSLVTEAGSPADDVDNSQQQARYKDQWSAEDRTRIKTPSQIEFPNLVFEKKK